MAAVFAVFLDPVRAQFICYFIHDQCFTDDSAQRILNGSRQRLHIVLNKRYEFAFMIACLSSISFSSLQCIRCGVL